MERGEVDMTKSIKEIPLCGFEGCNNKGWIALYGKFVCGDCLVKYNKKKSEDVFNTKL